MENAAFRDHIAALKAVCSCRDIAVALGLRSKGKRFFCPACQADGAVHGRPTWMSSTRASSAINAGSSGDVIGLLVLAGQMTKADAIRDLESRAGLTSAEKGV